LINAGLSAGLDHGQSVPRWTLRFKTSPRNLTLSYIRVV
jgi:hypothetical protein